MKAFQEGQVLTPLVKPPFTREQLQEYALASGDHNAIHLNEKEAQQAGHPTVIVHGMLSMAYMADHVRMNFPEDQFVVKRLKTRFRKVTYPGDALSCEGTVRKILEGGAYRVELVARNQQGEVTAEGEAVIQPL